MRLVYAAGKTSCAFTFLLTPLSSSLHHRGLRMLPVPIPQSLFVCRQMFAFVVGGQLSSCGWIRQTVPCAALHKRLLRYCGSWVPAGWWGNLPGSGAQGSLDKVSQSKEKEHYKNPGQFPGDHSNVIVCPVHELPATGNASGVAFCAAVLVIPT